MKKAFVGVICVLLISVGGLFLFPWDQDIKSDADLILEVPSVSDSENAFVILPKESELNAEESKIIGMLTLDEQGVFLYSGKKIGDGAKTQIIERTQQLAVRIQAAAARLVYVCPDALKAFDQDTTACDSGWVKTLSNLLLFHASVAIERGETEKATQLHTSIAKLGHLLISQPAPLAITDYLIGSKLVHEVRKSIDVASYAPTNTDVEIVIKREYMNAAYILKKGLGNDPKVRYWFLPQATQNELAAMYRDNITKATSDCGEDIPEFATGLNREVAFSRLIKPNFKGDLLLEIANPGVLASKLYQFKCELNNSL